MTTLESPQKTPTNSEIEVLIENGEHLQLLEMVRNGQIMPEQLTELLKKDERKHWLRYRLRNLILGLR